MEPAVYDAGQARRIADEFARLGGLNYLDHAGATLYSETQMKNVFRDFSGNLYGNPHARSTTSQSTQDSIDIVRYQLLSHFHTNSDEYSVVFTSGTTQSLKLIAETFDFDDGTLVYLEDNHTSVLGMRSYAKHCRELKINDAHRIFEFGEGDDYGTTSRNGLFVFPAQSNFAGTKYPLEWIQFVKQGRLDGFLGKSHRWYTVLDAACFVSTNELRLDEIKADFVPISLYKIFGYPSGLGALLVRKGSENVLRKTYYGGGTVLMALSAENVMVPRANLQERFEDGTLPFLSILAVKHGLDTLKRLGLNMELISKHTFALAKSLFEGLASLRHPNELPVAVLYHADNFQDRGTQGGIVNFNLVRANQKYVGYAEVLHMANLHGIQLRTGCFCNPGACQMFLELSPADVRRHFEAGHVCGDQTDLVDERPTGSVRASFGYMSTNEDVRKMLIMVQTCFISPELSLAGDETDGVLISNDETLKTISGKLEAVLLYPVKSCAAYAPSIAWELTNAGLKYDRRWMVVNDQGSCVSQKQIRNLCLLKPTIDLKSNLLTLHYKDAKTISVPLETPEHNLIPSFFCDSKICGDQVQGYDCGDEVATWLSNNLEKSGLRLLRQSDNSGRSSKNGAKLALSLANQAQYLLVNKATIRWLQARLPPDSNISTSSLVNRFRPNFLVEFDKAFVENSLDEIKLGDIPFQFSGNCTRCQMICIDQETGTISKEPLQTLSRALNGNIRFGIYLNHQDLITSKNVHVKNSVLGQYLK